jgi:hypothetical protein
VYIMMLVVELYMLGFGVQLFSLLHGYRCFALVSLALNDCFIHIQF